MLLGKIFGLGPVLSRVVEFPVVVIYGNGFITSYGSASITSHTIQRSIITRATIPTAIAGK
jgi:hypothetical protein